MSRHSFDKGLWSTENGNRVLTRTCAVCGITKRDTFPANGGRTVMHYQRTGSTKWVTTILMCGDPRGPKSREERLALGIGAEERHAKRDVRHLADSLLPTEPAAPILQQRPYEPEPRRREFHRPEPLPQMLPAEAALTECLVVLKTVVRSIGEQGLLNKLPANERQMLANYFESKGYKDWYEYLKKF